MASDEIVVPSSPSDREAIKIAIRDISNIMTIVDVKRTMIKDSIAAISETFDLPKKAVRKMVKLYHAQTFQIESEETAAMEDLYTAVFPEQAV